MFRMCCRVTWVTLLAANLHAASPDTELMEAVRNGDIASIKEAVEAGARLNTPQGSAALMLELSIDARPTQKPEILELLLHHGANINLPDKRGMTSLLQCLATASDPKLLDILLSNGADVRVVNRDGESAILLAVRICLFEPVKRMLTLRQRRMPDTQPQILQPMCSTSICCVLWIRMEDTRNCSRSTSPRRDRRLPETGSRRSKAPILA